MSTLILSSLVNIKPKYIVVNKTDYPSVPLHVAICDCVKLAMFNDVCATVELVHEGQTFTIDGNAIIDQIQGNPKSTTN